MSVPTIALYASPPSSICSGPHSSQINSHASYDFDLNGRSPSPSSSPSSSATSSQKPLVGGLSSLFSSASMKHTSSSPSVKHTSSPSVSYANDAEELVSPHRGEELSSSYRYSILSSSMKRDPIHQSPVSVLHGPVSPVSCSATPITVSVRSANLFNGFVRHAVGPCVEYDNHSAAFQLQPDLESPPAPSIAMDELPFNMEDAFPEPFSEPYAKDLLLDAQSRHKIFYDEFVIRAFQEAEKAHRGQMRASGDPYLKHGLETAILLAGIGANSTVVATGLLHDTVDDAFVTCDHIREVFGAGVADLVEGVSKLSHLSKLAHDNDTASKTIEADRLHTMFLAIADARAVLIKLADRLHNMMTLDALPFQKRQRFAKETFEIFVPLANRLGIYTWKERLENLCFEHLHPDTHAELSSKLVTTYNEAVIASAVKKLEHKLKDQSISYHDLMGRHKSLYSIHCKMLKKKLNMDEIHDIHGLRLIVEKEADCYKALGIIHQMWPEVTGRFKDYIIHPKFNGYRSLHTVVMGEDKVPLEVQIRTKEMHLQAEFGFAAHWRYKEGDCKHSSFVLQMVEWARWIISWQCETVGKDQLPITCGDSLKLSCNFPSHSEDCPYSCKPHFGPSGPVFVIVIESDKMTVQEFPAQSTVMDLLERAQGSCRWTPSGFPVKEELRPRLNHAPVGDPMCKLKMGDVVELSPAIPDKSLTVYREEIQRMYNRGLPVSNAQPGTGTMTGLRS